MATLDDVARRAGVSKATVSRYLNGSLDLPDRTSGAIDAAILALDYTPNPHARRLSLGRSDTIGLIVPDIATPFFATLVSAIEAEAEPLGLSLALHATLNRPDRELSYLDRVRTGHADGLIFITNHEGSPELAQKLNRVARCIILDEDVPGALADRLFCDNADGGRLAGLHLATRGHRHVLFVGAAPAMISGARRLAGFRDGMAGGAAGAPVRIDLHHGPYSFDTGRAAAAAWLARPEADRPTAIFATSDEMTIGVIEALTAASVAIPEAVSLVGFDDVGPLHLFAAPVTAIRQPVRDLGRRALRRLLDTRPAAGPDRPPPAEELLPVTLIERKSVARPIR